MLTVNVHNNYMIAQLDIRPQTRMRCLRLVALVREKYIQDFGEQT